MAYLVSGQSTPRSSSGSDVSDISINSEFHESTAPLGILANLPIDIVYCIFEEMDPSTAISLALTNKSNLWFFTQWLDATKSLQDFWGGPDIHEMFHYLRDSMHKKASIQQRRDAAEVLRKWQSNVMQAREGQQRWNVCNGCLKFKLDHCKTCAGVCERFICDPYCVGL